MVGSKQIRVEYPRSFYETRAMLLGREYNGIYHMIVQRPSNDFRTDFMLWDADTMELIGHSNNYSRDRTLGMTVVDNWVHRRDVEYTYPPEPEDKT